jgi:hypothetical protein
MVGSRAHSIESVRWQAHVNTCGKLGGPSDLADEQPKL